MYVSRCQPVNNRCTSATAVDDATVMLCVHHYLRNYGLIRIGQEKRWGNLTLLLMNAQSQHTPIGIFWRKVSKPSEKYMQQYQDEVFRRLSISLNRSELKYSSLKTLTEKGGDFLTDSCSLIFILIICCQYGFQVKTVVLSFVQTSLSEIPKT